MATRKLSTDTPLGHMMQRKQELVDQFLKGAEPDFLHKHTQLLDEYFQTAYAASRTGMTLTMSGQSYAVIAQGGYGRQEQCVFSDIDLLILFDKKVPNEAEQLVQDIIYPLWDIGLDVGHAIRTVNQCVEVAQDNLEALTALLDARFICGQSSLYSRMSEIMRKTFARRHAAGVIEQLIAANRARHEHFGDATFLLEPNLKEGRGGLRDYHTLLWVGRIRDDLQQPRDLEFSGRLSHDEYLEMSRSLGFIWDVRNRLHILTSRKSDQLYFQHQERLAEQMGFLARKGQQPVESFLSRLHRHMAFIRDQLELHIYELDVARKPRKGRRGAAGKPRVDSVVLKDGMLAFASSADIPRHPELLMVIFAESARLQIPLGAEARRLVREFGYLFTKRFRRFAAARKCFEEILSAREADTGVLEAMLQCGILGRYLPEFGDVEDRIQYDTYHIHPVDKHLLRTVQIIKRFGTPDDPTEGRLRGQVMGEVGDPLPLLWGALLHDIGKGTAEGDHSDTGAAMTRRILTEKGYDEAFVETVEFLVREHLFLMKVATRRDIRDESTALSCARKIKTPERLRMLYLLSVADAIATGPKAWNDWHATLLENLFLNVLNSMKSGELTSGAAVETMDRKKHCLVSLASTPEERREVERLVTVMSPRYLLHTREERLGQHVALYRTLGNKSFVWRIEPHPSAPDLRMVTFCGKDRPGLFSRIAGVFTLNGIDVLGAEVFTWRNNVALDIFRVTPPPDRLLEEEKWRKAARDLEAVLDGSLDLGAALRDRLANYGAPRPRIGGKPDRIVIDNETSSFFTIIEVFTHDSPGLLHRVTDALFRCGLDVWLARIATKVDQVVDVFYVRDFDGQKVDSPEQEAAIRAAVGAEIDDAAVTARAA